MTVLHRETLTSPEDRKSFRPSNEVTIKVALTDSELVGNSVLLLGLSRQLP